MLCAAVGQAELTEDRGSSARVEQFTLKRIENMAAALRLLVLAYALGLGLPVLHRGSEPAAVNFGTLVVRPAGSGQKVTPPAKGVGAETGAGSGKGFATGKMIIYVDGDTGDDCNDGSKGKPFLSRLAAQAYSDNFKARNDGRIKAGTPPFENPWCQREKAVGAFDRGRKHKEGIHAKRLAAAKGATPAQPHKSTRRGTRAGLCKVERKILQENGQLVAQPAPAQP